MEPTSERRPVSLPANLMVRPPMSLPKTQPPTLPPTLPSSPPASVTPHRPRSAPLCGFPKLPGQDGVREGTLVIGQGIQVKGEIGACDILIVEGTVEASLQARCLEIRPGGRFIGEAVVVEAKIEGSFEGELKVSETLTLSRHGRVKGSTRYGGLQVEKGGQLSGDIDLRPVELSLA